MKTAILVFIDNNKMDYDIKYMIDELTNLCQSNNIIAVDYLVQKIDKPNKEFFIGSGKVLELKEKAIAEKVQYIIFDDELSPSQIRNLENEIGIPILDRSYIILDIFASRAKTKEAILEIELARSKYLLPRLGALSEGLSRQGGSSGRLHNKGKGETKLELNRRVLLSNIIRNERELIKIKKMKDMQAEKRKNNKIPIVALVGYTNAGKSSTMNKIIEYTSNNEDKMVYSKDELFATLETSHRKITYKKHDFILVDTIGFVSKLPHHLINSFRSTLSEIKNADLIIHVVDISSRYFNEQYQITTDVLFSLNCANIKTLLLLNKYDKYDDENTIIVGAENLPYSNYTNLNVDTLLDYIYDNTIPYMIDLRLNIDYKYGKIINLIEEKATINSKIYFNEYIYYDIKIDKKYYKELSIFEINSNLS